MRTQYPDFFALNGLTKSQDDFISLMAQDLATAWSTWQSSLLFGGATVTGVGLVTWAGSGVGGQFLPNPLPFTAQNPPEFVPTAPNTAYRASLTSAIQSKFDNFMQTFTLIGAPYLGTSSATPLSPGVFFATITPLTLMSAATGPYMDGAAISAAIQSGLGFVPPATDYYDAIGSALDGLFNDWLSLSTLTGNTVTGVAAPGAGTGVSVSLTDGLVV
jgi:hypothetical protein